MQAAVNPNAKPEDLSSPATFFRLWRKMEAYWCVQAIRRPDVISPIWRG